MTDAPERWIAVASLLRPQGRRGELLAEPLSDLEGLFVPGRVLRLATATTLEPRNWQKLPAGPADVVLEGSWAPTGRNAGRVVLKLAGVDSISAAEALAGRDLLIQEKDLPARDSDTYLVRDLLGCVLYNGDSPAGEIVDVEFPMAPGGRTRQADAAPLLSVRTSEAADAEPVLVPFVKAWLVAVDPARREVRMVLPEGLLDVPHGDSQESGGPEDV